MECMRLLTIVVIVESLQCMHEVVNCSSHCGNCCVYVCISGVVCTYVCMHVCISA